METTPLIMKDNEFSIRTTVITRQDTYCEQLLVLNVTANASNVHFTTDSKLIHRARNQIFCPRTYE